MKTEFEKWEAQVKRHNIIAKGLMLMVAVVNFTAGYVFTNQGEPIMFIIGCISYVLGLWMLYMAVEECVG